MRGVTSGPNLETIACTPLHDYPRITEAEDSQVQRPYEYTTESFTLGQTAIVGGPATRGPYLSYSRDSLGSRILTIGREVGLGFGLVASVASYSQREGLLGATAADYNAAKLNLYASYCTYGASAPPTFESECHSFGFNTETGFYRSEATIEHAGVSLGGVAGTVGVNISINLDALLHKISH